MTSPLADLIEQRLAELRKLPEYDVEHRARALQVFIACASHGSEDHLKRVAALRERAPALADQIEALIAERSAQLPSLTAAALADERDLGIAQMAALAQPRPSRAFASEADVWEGSEPMAHQRPPYGHDAAHPHHSTSGEFPRGLSQEFLSNPTQPPSRGAMPSRLAVEALGPELAAEQARQVRHQHGETEAEFSARRARGGQAAASAERWARQARQAADPATRGSGWLKR